jgi:hypothetical protein
MEPDDGYEFSETQDETILTLAKTLKFVGAAALALALVFAAGCLFAVAAGDWPEVISQAMVMIFTLSMGSLMIKAGGEFYAIVATAGEDISHLMKALDNLRQMYSILSVIIIIMILLLLIALALSMGSPAGPVIA